MWLLIGSFCILVIIFLGGFTVKKKKRNGDWQEKLFGPGVDFLQTFIKKDDEFFRATMPKVLAVLWILHLFVLCLVVSGFVVSGDISVSKVDRNTYFGAEKKETLYVETEAGKEMELEVILSGREYSEKEIDEFFQQAKEELPKLILGENESLEAVTKDLNLVTEIEGNPLSIMWETPLEEASITEVVAILSFMEREERLTIPIGYAEEAKTEEDILKEKIAEEVEKKEEESRTEASMELPDEVEGNAISWFRKGSGNIEGMTFFILLIGVLIFWKEKENQQKQEELKKSRMVLEYPELVSKLTLLLGAGMTLQRAWEKIVKEYKEKRENGKIPLRYSYEEMYLTFKEMESGIPLKTVLNSFGKRIGIPRYLKFSTLLVQNLKRGSAGLLERLEIEAVDSFEERKAIARQLGEQASTKLLFPMMLMLVIVMVLIMVPAFFSFNL